MLTEIYAYEEAPKSYCASLFLVGPTPRTDADLSWRPKALKILAEVAEQKDIELVVFIPESRHSIYRTNYLDQVEWEKQHLEMADAILAWIPRNMETSLKGLTTNIEFGKYVESGKLFYGRPDNAQNIKYLDWMYSNVTRRKPKSDLAVLIEETINYLQKLVNKCANSLRQAGERYIPLNIWSLTPFQSWYQSQRQAGNQLIKAKLLWTFIIPKINFTFSYALHVDVWIAAEDRIKSNEFILSRSDISVVVPYWKHPTDIFASEIVLIKEFRSPARTKNGFVYELPSGSNFKQHGDQLQLASDELFEETSLKITSDRFRYLDSKQLVATWSTHFADVYAIELEAHEIEYARQIANSNQSFGITEDTERTYVQVYKLKEISQYVDWSMEGMIYRAVLGNL
jgi:hypothetical protein